MEGPDHRASLDPLELKLTVNPSYQMAIDRLKELGVEI